MITQPPEYEGIRAMGSVGNQPSRTGSDLLTTRAQALNNTRRDQPSHTDASFAIIDASRSRAQVHNDLLTSRDRYLQSEAATEDWTQKHTNQQYALHPVKSATNTNPDISQINGPNPFEVGSKEWMEEFDKRMGFPVPTLPERPRNQKVRGETYKEWYVRHGCKAKWDPWGICMVEPSFESANQDENILLEDSTGSGWLLYQCLEGEALNSGMADPNVMGLSSSKVARNKVEDERFPFTD